MSRHRRRRCYKRRASIMRVLRELKSLVDHCKRLDPQVFHLVVREEYGRFCLDTETNPPFTNKTP